MMQNRGDDQQPPVWQPQDQGQQWAQQPQEYEQPQPAPQRQEGWTQPGSVQAPPPYGYQAPAPAAGVRPRSRWKTPLIALLALGVGIAIGAAAGGSKSPSTAGAASGTPSGAASSAPSAATGQSSPAKPAAAAAPVKNVLLKLSGNGEKTTKSFTVARGDWSLAYTYNCKGFGMDGNFIVYEDYPSGNIVTSTSGTKGGDTAYVHGDNGKHSLDVSSECDWTITVTDGDGG